MSSEVGEDVEWRHDHASLKTVLIKMAWINLLKSVELFNPLYSGPMWLHASKLLEV